MKNTLFRFAVCLTMTLLLIVLTCAPVSAQTEYTAGSFIYVVSQENAAITRYCGSDEQLIIPAELGGYPVTRICLGAFRNCKTLISVTVPSSVISIGESVPAEDGSVAPLEEYDSTKVIGWNCGTVSIRLSRDRSVFAGCTSLQSIHLPEDVAAIYKDAFFDCNADVYYPKGSVTEQTLSDLKARPTPVRVRPTRTPRSQSATPAPTSAPAN